MTNVCGNPYESGSESKRQVLLRFRSDPAGYPENLDSFCRPRKASGVVGSQSSPKKCQPIKIRGFRSALPFSDRPQNPVDYSARGIIHGKDGAPCAPAFGTFKGESSSVRRRVYMILTFL